MADPKAPAPKRRKITRRGKTLTTAEKAEAITLWRNGSTTLDELAARFDRDRTTFLRLFNNEGVTKGEASAELARKVAEVVDNNAVNEAGVIAQRIRETKEDHYKMIRGMSKLAWSTLAAAKTEKKPLATTINDLKAIQTATQIFKISREECFALLGLDDKDRNDDTPMPDLVLHELTADQIKEMTSQRVEEDDLGIAAGAPEMADEDDGSLPE